MHCPGCGAPMRLDDDKDFFTCDYCDNVFFPEPDDYGELRRIVQAPDHEYVEE